VETQWPLEEGGGKRRLGITAPKRKGETTSQGKTGETEGLEKQSACCPSKKVFDSERGFSLFTKRGPLGSQEIFLKRDTIPTGGESFLACRKEKKKRGKIPYEEIPWVYNPICGEVVEKKRGNKGRSLFNKKEEKGLGQSDQ